MTRDEFKSICAEYIGEITESEFEVSIKSKNLIKSFYTSGEVARQKVVGCEIGLEKFGRLFGDEETWSIIGGFGGMSATEENLRYELERYGFKKKQSVQISLFELF